MEEQEKVKREKGDTLIDGKYSIRDLIDLERLRVIFKKFTASTGFTIGFLDHPGLNILIRTGWKDICTKFHRSCPTSLENCTKSNRDLLDQLTAPGQLVIKACKNGLVDCGTPIIIKGKHIASLATGQLLLKEPDLERFKRQAKEFGYDEAKYLKALKEVLVVPEDKLKKVTSFLGEIAWFISKMGYANLEIQEERALLTKEIVERKKAEEKLKELALIDSHTNLYNYRYFGDAMERELARAERDVFPLSLAMLDIDYFKSIDDVYGHQFGDLVLKQFAQQIKMLVRKQDIVARYGGEEFVILSPGLNFTAALVLGRRIIDFTRLHSFGDKINKVKLKISIGIASYPVEGITKSEQLIALADRILNKAKEDGGNRVYTIYNLKNVEKKRLSQKRKLGKDKNGEIQYLQEKIGRLTKRANQSLIEAIFAFAKTIELKDRYTSEHVERSVHYATGISRELDLSEQEIENVIQATILHDLGKIGISEKILQKKSKLTKKEFEEIKQHPKIAEDILRPIHIFHELLPLIVYHHERWDGKGYPYGLKGKDIPLGARIVAVADVYEALTANRPYRKAYSKLKAISIITSEAGSHFDPKVVTAFLQVVKKDK